jgi:hypothetical protein
MKTDNLTEEQKMDITFQTNALGEAIAENAALRRRLETMEQKLQALMETKGHNQHFSITSKRKSYSLEDKKRVIEWIISEGDGIPTRASKQFKLPSGTVRSWWNSREGVLNASASDLDRRRLIGGGRKGMMLDYDEDPFLLEEGLQETIVLED